MDNYAKVTPEILTALESVVGVRNVSTDREKREVYSYDEVNRGYWDGEYVAEVVVFPESPEHVAAVLALANERRIPVTPRGAGTGLSGGAVPLHRGIVLSFEKMNRILELDTDNLTITVEPGIVTAEITKAARAAGLLYAGDPCSGDASFIGGNVAENAGGNKVVKYGSTGASVLALEAVLPDGSVTWFGGKRRKDVTGYDFVHLLVGSEGTLAVVTKIVLKLLPLPARVVDLLIPFPDTESAVSFVPRILRETKVVPSSIEFMDRTSILLAQRYLNIRLPHDDAGAHLIVQLEGNDPKMLADEYERVGDLCFAHGALEVFVADNRNVRDKLWKARKCLAEAIMAFSAHSCLEDIAVPSSAVPELMRRTAAITDRWGIEGVHFGHIGDGNMHINFMLPEKRSDWHDLFCGALRELYAAARDLGGTISGEHGIGLKRRDYITTVLDPAQVELIRRVKRAFDPNNILNPGKIVPEALS
jgi:glycolate oxidase